MLTSRREWRESPCHRTRPCSARVGVIPAPRIISSFVSYAVEESVDASAEFGQGAVREGQARSRHNAALRRLVPMLAWRTFRDIRRQLGAMMVHGVSPGP